MSRHPRFSNFKVQGGSHFGNRGLANISEILYGKQVKLQKLLVMCTLRPYQKGIHPSINVTLFLALSFGAVNGLISAILRLDLDKHHKRTLLKHPFYINGFSLNAQNFRFAVCTPNKPTPL